MQDRTISCLCITYKRINYLQRAILCFNVQTHPKKELIIIYQDNDELTIQFLIDNPSYGIFKLKNKNVAIQRKPNSNIKFIEVSKALSLGTKRNLSIDFAKGDLVCIWDDDDYFPPNRLSDQLTFLDFSGKSANTLSSLVLYHEKSSKFYVSNNRNTGWEGSLMCKKSKIGKYHDLNKKEDTPVIDDLLNKNELSIMQSPELYIYFLHNKNTSGEGHFEEMLNYAIEMPAKEAKLLKENIESLDLKVNWEIIAKYEENTLKS